MRLEPYRQYKPSGLEWLGRIPEHWGTRPLKWMADFVNGYGFSPSEWKVEGTPIIRIENLNGGTNFNYVTGEYPKKFHAYDGDLLFGWSGNRGTSFGPFLWWKPGLAYVNQHIFRICGFEADKGWLYWALKAVTFYVERQAHGIIGMVHITRGELGGIAVPNVSLPEQRAIAAFLDRETAKIDELIEKKRRLIELLEEKRTALISHVVTKGLDPNVPMKDSGVEWLGEVPAHWEVGALSYALDAVGDVDHYMPSSVEDGVPYLMTGDLKELASEIDFGRCKQIAHDDYLRLCRKIKTTKGDLIMARYATIGTVSYVDLDAEFLVSYSCVTIKPNAEKALGRYLFFCLKSDSFVQGIQERVNTNTQGNVGIADLRKVKVVLPPLKEQEKIADHLTVECDRCEEGRRLAERQIGLFREYRQSLITAAVTGKIDVRNEVEVEA